MGVLGLAPFLQKVCPDVIRELPNRLKTLAGKTLVLDATLITTRFHFSSIPHDRRHVLGWYRLLNELKQNNVKVICVFDGKERVVAKRAENARRRELREAALARGNVEQSRAKRLREFERTLPFLTPDILSRHPSLISKLAETSSSSLPLEPRSKSSVRKERSLGDGSTSTVDQDIVSSKGFPTDATSRDDAVTSSGAEGVERDEASLNLSKALAGLSVAESAPPPTGDEVARTLETLYDSYAKAPKLLVLDAPTAPDPTSVFEEGVDATADVTVSLTRSQREIAVSEREIWASILHPLDDMDTLQSQLSDLAYRSETISSSYRRNAELPKAETFAESKVMIEAMGIPWLETKGNAEAEAIAACLVRNGIADYVASEDTDVLVYQAPLIRNITTQSEPLSIIDASEIPAKLKLSTSSFVDFAVLIGTDFSPRLKGLGPHRALKLLQTHGTIEQVLQAAKPRYTPEPQQTVEEYLQQIDVARQIFSFLPPLPPMEELQPKTEYDEQLVNDILEQFELAWLAGRASRDDTHSSTSLQTDYFANAPNDPSFRGGQHALADNPHF